MFNSIKKFFASIKKFILRIPRHLKDPKERKLILRDTFLILLVLFIVCSGAFLLWAASLKIPDLSSFDDRLLGQSAKIYDRTGTVLLYDLSEKVRRTVVPFDQISPFVKNATVAIEDDSFYQHKGIKATSIIRAIFADIFSLSFSQGGSTITQQVVKNSLLTNNKDISRKLKEWILAIKLEQTTDKDSILDLYLNDTSYGGSIYGVEEASEAFFGVHAADLTLAESAYLAAIPQAPTYYSPYGDNKADLDTRKNLVLKKMLENNLITDDQYNGALAEVVTFLPKDLTGIKAPHFVMFVKSYLESKYDDETLQTGGLKVITTLNWDLEQKAEDIVKNYVETNEKKFQASNGALVAIDPKTGQILTMVGSRDYFDTEIPGNFNVATAHRQPGSSFKPFVYATAFNKGFVPESPIYDVFTEFNADCTPEGNPKPEDPTAKCYHPQNYEGGFEGLLSLRTALDQSRNVAAVRLLYMVGVNDSITTARAMGINSLTNEDQYGLTLVLGGGEVSLLDMTSAYGVFANDGARNPYASILEIDDGSGNKLEQFATSTTQVLPQQTARLMNDVLSDTNARSSIFGAQYFGDYQVAMKTGTTNDYRDVWILGYTPTISVGAWMGNDDDSPMTSEASALIVTPMWKQFMDYALTVVPTETFIPPEPTDPTIKPFLQGVWQGPGNEVHSELYWIDRNDPAGPPPTPDQRDSLYDNFEYGVNGWAGTPTGQEDVQKAIGTASSTNGTSTTTVNPATTFQITSPGLNAALQRNVRTTVTVGNIPPTTSKVDYYVDTKLIGTATEAPFSFSFIPGSISTIEDEDTLNAIYTDLLGNHEEASVNFSVVN